MHLRPPVDLPRPSSLGHLQLKLAWLSHANHERRQEHGRGLPAMIAGGGEAGCASRALPAWPAGRLFWAQAPRWSKGRTPTDELPLNQVRCELRLSGVACGPPIAEGGNSSSSSSSRRRHSKGKNRRRLS